MAARMHDRDLVDLVVGGIRRHAAQVEQVGPGFALVRLLCGPPARLDGPAALEAVSRAGFTRIEGTAVLGEDGRTVRFCAEQGLGRRRFPRVAVDRECILARADGTTGTGRVVDISAGGMLVAAPGAVALEELVGFALCRPGGKPYIEGHARCIRESVGGALAFEFESLSERAERDLVELVDAALA